MPRSTHTIRVDVYLSGEGDALVPSTCDPTMGLIPGVEDGSISELEQVGAQAALAAIRASPLLPPGITASLTRPV